MALLVQLELVQAAERLPALRANVAPCHAGERSVRGVAACGEGVVRGSYSWSLSGCSLPLGEIIRLPQKRVHLFFLLCLVTLMSGLKTGRLWNIFLILAVVVPITRPLRGRLLHSSRLGRV